MIKLNKDSVASIKQGEFGNQSWRSDAFLNFYLPTRDGGRTKIGAIALKKSRGIQAQLIEYLAEDPETRVPELLAKLEIDFRMGSNGEGTKLDL